MRLQTLFAARRGAGLVAVTAALLLATVDPAHASFDSISHSTDGQGPAGTWSASASSAADGSFSLATSTDDDEPAPSTEQNPSATAEVRAVKTQALSPGLYEATVTFTGVTASIATSEAGFSSVGAAIVGACQGCIAVARSEDIVGGRSAATSVGDATVTLTMQFIVEEQTSFTLHGVVSSRAGTGTSGRVLGDTASWGAGAGTASASASGVVASLTIVAL